MWQSFAPQIEIGCARVSADERACACVYIKWQNVFAVLWLDQFPNLVVFGILCDFHSADLLRQAVVQMTALSSDKHSERRQLAVIDGIDQISD